MLGLGPISSAAVAAYACVVVLSVSPAAGLKTGGTNVTIKGVNFAAASTITFGVTAPTGPAFVDNATLTCTTAAGDSVYIDDVTVTNAASDRCILRGAFDRTSGTTSTSLDPATLALTGDWMDYAGAPWPGIASTGTSGSNPMDIGAYAAPATGTLNGHGTAVFNGTTHALSTALTGRGMLGGNEGDEVYGWTSLHLCKFPSLPLSGGPAYVNACLMSFEGAVTSLSVSSDLGVRCTQIDESDGYANYVDTPASPVPALSTWILVQTRWQGSRLECRFLDGTLNAWGSVLMRPPVYPDVGWTIIMGRDYSATAFVAGEVAAAVTAKRAFSTHTLDGVTAFYQARYALVLGVPTIGPLSGTTTISVTSAASAFRGAGALTGSTPIAATASGTLVAAGALAGSSSIAVTPSGALQGAAALSGASAIAVAFSGTLQATGLLSGSTPLAVTSSGTLRGAGALAGSSTIGVTSTGTLQATGSLSGSSTVDVISSGSLQGAGSLSGGSSISLPLSGTLTAQGVLAGSSTIAVSPAGSLEGAGSLSSSTTLALTPTGSLQGNGPLSGTTTVVLSSSGALFGTGLLAGATTIAIASGGLLTGDAPLDGSTTLAITSIGALLGEGALAGGTSLSLSSTGLLEGSGSLAGVTPLAINPIGSMRGVGSLSGASPMSLALAASVMLGVGSLSGDAGPITIAAGGALQGSASLGGSAPIVVTLSGTLLGEGVIDGSTPIAIDVYGDLRDVLHVGALSGSTFISLQQSGELRGVGALSGSTSFTFDVHGVVVALARVPLLVGNAQAFAVATVGTACAASSTRAAVATIEGGALLKRLDLNPAFTAYLEFPQGTRLDLSPPRVTSVQFLMKPLGGGAMKVNAPCIITNAVTGSVIYVWQGVDTDTAGQFLIEFVVHYQDGTTLRVPGDTYLSFQITPELS